MSSSDGVDVFFRRRRLWLRAVCFDIAAFYRFYLSFNVRLSLTSAAKSSNIQGLLWIGRNLLVRSQHVTFVDVFDLLLT